TMEAYLDAKSMLFDGRNDPQPVKTCAAVINASDPACAKIEASARRGGMRVWLYRGEPGDVRPGLAVQVTALAAEADGLELELRLDPGPWGEASAPPTLRLRLPLLGRYNAANAAAAVAA